jgi:Zn-dependent protease with chaperone function
MNAPYVFRLLCLSLAAFFIVHLAAEIILAASAPFLIRLAEGMRARSAASLLFAARMAPWACAIFVVAVICVPSYLWFEPPAIAEDVGAVCLCAALLGLALCVGSMWRALHAIAGSRRFYRRCRASGQRIDCAGDRTFVIDGECTAALAGLSSPIVVLSRDVLDALSPQQIDAAVRHERAHAASRDNFKRLAIIAAPHLLRSALLDRAWKRFAEWASDDAAVAGDRERALTLAAALVQVARLGIARQPCTLTTSLAAEDLEARVERLLDGSFADQRPSVLPPASLAAATAAMCAILLHPAALDIVHRALERLLN